MAQLNEKMDESARRALRSLEPTEALSIMTDLQYAGESIRNPSAQLCFSRFRCLSGAL